MDLEHKSIERIKMASEMGLHHYGKTLVCTYSGGKDSDVMLELFKRSGVPFEVVNSHTTVDAPPTVYHIRKKFSELENQGIKAAVHKPELSMWELIVKNKIPPSRFMRYCCEYLKENTVKNRFVATGVRWAESNNRKNRREIEPKGKDLLIFQHTKERISGRSVKCWRLSMGQGKKQNGKRDMMFSSGG